MELLDQVIRVESFFAVTIGIISLLIGKRINDGVRVLREFSIPEPVTGGLLFSMLFTLVYAVSGYAVEFELGARDFLLVYFFTTIGINAHARDLLAGGRPLVILLGVTIAFMFLQNLTGIGVAGLFGLSPAVGVTGGTVSLIGGHGTTIAWAPTIAAEHGLVNAMEIGIASATFGLILASLMGGPIAKFLINRHRLSPSPAVVDEVQDVGGTERQTHEGRVGYLDFLGAILAIHICIVIGTILNEAIADFYWLSAGLAGRGLQLPLFVTCLFTGILITNLVPRNLQSVSGLRWPTRSPAIALIAEIALGTFLAMSLMSLQLWTLVDLAAPIFAILAAQFALAVLVTLLVLFPLMGRDYDAAVVCAGFGGVTLGSTPTAIANMAAVTNRFGASHRAFIIVPLVGAFFIDLTNALVIPYFLRTF
jgi:ESS family glutamate:Na+ symporter